jgi:rhamnose transport system permease protein
MSLATRRLSPQAFVSLAFRLREVGVLLALVAATLFFALRATNFMTVSNWQDIGTDVAMVVVVGVGETMVILTRNIDLSVGSTVGLTAFLSSSTLASHNGLPLVAIALLAMAIGAALGLGNGLLVAWLRIPAIIATLATLSIYRGVLFQVHEIFGSDVFAFQLPQSFLYLASRKVLGVPFLAILALGVALAGAATLRWTNWGRDFYAVGSNPEAARYHGIPVRRRILTAFILSGMLAGLGGFMFAARFATVSVVSASGFEFDVITAVVIGGVNVFGGSGTILGMVLGAVLVGTFTDGFILLRVSEFWKIAFQGFAILLAITIDALITQQLQEALRRRRRREVLAARDARAAPS